MPSHLERLFVHLGLTLVMAAVLLIIRTVLFRLFHRWADKSESHLDDLIIRSVRIPSIFWCLAVGLYVGLDLSEYSGKYLFYLSRIIYILLIFSMTLAAASLVGKLFIRYFQKSNMPIPTTGLVHGLLQGIFWVVGMIIILNFLGIPITPMITALGVGGLAMALALQDTLANFFAGIHIMMEKSVRVGDFIKLESGQEGVVEDITWRTTRVKMLPNNMVIIPNLKFSQSIVTNYSLPEKRMSLSIPVSVSYQSDPEKVEAVLEDIAKTAIGEIPGLLNRPEPFVRFIPGFGDSSMDFTLTCQVEEFVDQYLVQHELRKRIFKGLKAAGLEIPYPHRTVYIREEKEWEKDPKK
ncbi:MAG: mechanosensitive ion channel family protein [Deltaproteobacteria bacterium]|nr:mechanosensitive ion channel family protein [Deltaproteobacteria bacterium]